MERNEQLETENIAEISDKKFSFPSVLEMAALFGVIILTQICVIIVANILIESLYPNMASDVALGWKSFFSHLISMVAAISMVVILRRKHVKDGEPTPQRIGYSLKGLDPLSILCGFIMLLATNIVLEPLVELLPKVNQEIPTVWTTLLTVTICAPILEEILCRGLLYESLSKKWGVWRAMFISSLFFGVLHLYPSSIIVAFFAGLILCFFYIYSKSLITPVILHMLNNAMAYLFIVLKWDEFTIREVVTSDLLYYIIYGSSVVVIIISALYCRKRLKAICKL